MEDKTRIYKLATSIRKKFEKLPSISSKCCIYKIPQTLREFNESAYTPCLISIGPFHYNEEILQPMQQYKLRYLQNFLKRNEKKNLLDYLNYIRQWEKQIRHYYVENVELGSDEFNDMVLLDGCFLIEFFLVWFFDEAEDNDGIFKKPSLEVVILRDISLLENQLPFFILEGLYNIAFRDKINNSESAIDCNYDHDDDGSVSSSFPSLVELCCKILVREAEISENFSETRVLHLVDLIRACYLPSCLREPNEIGNENFVFPPGVESLHDAGVQFTEAKNRPLLDIEFSNGVLKIPRLEVEDHTESLLLNLSAFEQCHYHFDSYIVDYILFMDVLITTLKDVNILMDGGIIVNSLGNKEDFAEIFNTISRGTTYQSRGFYYNHLCKQLNEYYKVPWHKWRATLKHDYFSNPWTIISVVVAIVLLILTVVQTICTIISM